MKSPVRKLQSSRLLAILQQPWVRFAVRMAIWFAGWYFFGGGIVPVGLLLSCCSAATQVVRRRYSSSKWWWAVEIGAGSLELLVVGGGWFLTGQLDPLEIPIFVYRRFKDARKANR